MYFIFFMDARRWGRDNFGHIHYTIQLNSLVWIGWTKHIFYLKPKPTQPDDDRVDLIQVIMSMKKKCSLR